MKKKIVLVSSYKTCFNIYSNFIRIKYKYHYFNGNVRYTDAGTSGGHHKK